MTDTRQLAERHVVIVDDNPAVAAGRRGWLLDAGFRHVTLLNFSEGLAYEGGWREVHTLVVDGFDETSDDDRREEAARLGLSDFALADERYMGVRVVRAARKVNPDTVIIVVSSFVDGSPALVERMHTAGATYIYAHRDAHRPDDFVSAVLCPYRRNRSVPVPADDKRILGLSNRTQIQAALDLLDTRTSKWPPLTVLAVRKYLLEGQPMPTVLVECRVTRRQIDRCLGELLLLLELTQDGRSGATDTRRVRVERVRAILQDALGRKHGWFGKGDKARDER